MVFGNYTKIVYLAQTEDAELQEKARWAADYLGLEYEYRFTGYGDLTPELKARLMHFGNSPWPSWGHRH